MNDLEGKTDKKSQEKVNELFQRNFFSPMRSRIFHLSLVCNNLKFFYIACLCMCMHLYNSTNMIPQNTQFFYIILNIGISFSIPLFYRNIYVLYRPYTILSTKDCLLMIFQLYVCPLKQTLL